MCINQIPHICIHVLIHTIPTFIRCNIYTAIPIGDGLLLITDTIDLFVIITINKRMRQIVRDVLVRRKLRIRVARCRKLGKQGVTMFAE